jgi:antitoxin HicB
VEIRPLSAEVGGGFLATFADPPGCMADGETPEQAIADARRAFASWMAAHIGDGRPVPPPGGGQATPVRFVRRLPRSVHAYFSPSWTAFRLIVHAALARPWTMGVVRS